MTKFLLLGLFLFTFFGGMAVYQARDRMSSARLGSDVTYTLDPQGAAQVEMVEKTYYVDEDTRKNFEVLVNRTGRPDPEKFGKGIESSLVGLMERIGRTGMVVSDFDAAFERHDGYGARRYTFKWEGFAESKDGNWVIDFRGADGMKLTKDSALTVVLPSGARVLAVDPAPSAQESGKLVWNGPAEIPWPYIEYR